MRTVRSCVRKRRSTLCTSSVGVVPRFCIMDRVVVVCIPRLRREGIRIRRLMRLLILALRNGIRIWCWLPMSVIHGVIHRICHDPALAPRTETRIIMAASTLLKKKTSGSPPQFSSSQGVRLCCRRFVGGRGRGGYFVSRKDGGGCVRSSMYSSYGEDRRQDRSSHIFGRRVQFGMVCWNIRRSGNEAGAGFVCSCGAGEV